MKYTITILSIFIFSTYSNGQKYVFSPTGTMGNSRVYVDTVYRTSLKINNKIVFSCLDNTYADTLNLVKVIGKKYNLILKDTLEYFFWLI